MEVLLGEGGEEEKCVVETTALSRVAEEALYRGVVSTALGEEVKEQGAILAGGTQPVRQRGGLLCCGEGGGVRLTDRILLGEQAGILCRLGLGIPNLRRLLHRRSETQVLLCRDGVERTESQLEGAAALLIGHLLHRDQVLALGGKDHHIPETEVGHRFPSSIGCSCDERIELCVVVDAVGDGGALDRLTGLVQDADGHRRGADVIGRHIELGEAIVLAQHLLVAIVVTEGGGVEHHRPHHRGVKPGVVQHGGRFACPEVVPLTIDPSLDPGVVVVRMRPAGRVDLSRRDADGPEHRNDEGTLLAAAPEGIPQRGYGAGGPPIGGLVGDVLMSPAIERQHRLLHGHGIDEGGQLIVVGGPKVIQHLVIDPLGEDKSTEESTRDFLSPRHLLPRPQCHPDIIQMVGNAVIHQVRQTHIGVEVGHGVPLLGGHVHEAEGVCRRDDAEGVDLHLEGFLRTSHHV